MIPDEAVDAAVDALLGSRLGDRPGISGEEFVEAAIAALEAAAPHLMASAWDEGYMFSYDQERGGHGVGAIPIPEYLADDLAHWNPHRTPDA